MHLIHFVINISPKMYVTKTVRQRIPSRRAHNSKAPMTEAIQSIEQYDQLPLRGRLAEPQMLMTSNIYCECKTVHQVSRRNTMQILIHEHCELKLYLIGDIKPVKLIMQYLQ